MLTAAIGLFIWTFFDRDKPGKLAEFLFGGAFALGCLAFLLGAASAVWYFVF
jgi:hypothetical protein